MGHSLHAGVCHAKILVIILQIFVMILLFHNGMSMWPGSPKASISQLWNLINAPNLEPLNVNYEGPEISHFPIVKNYWFQ